MRTPRFVFERWANFLLQEAYERKRNLFGVRTARVFGLRFPGEAQILRCAKGNRQNGKCKNNGRNRSFAALRMRTCFVLGMTTDLG